MTGSGFGSAVVTRRHPTLEDPLPTATRIRVVAGRVLLPASWKWDKKSREVIGMRGSSMLPYMTGNAANIHPKDFVGPERWQLFNIVNDPGKAHDVSEQYPEKVKELAQRWDQYVLDTGVIPPSPELDEYIAATEE
ncbi:hypothetical protein F5Y10DRAFT_262350 [Nemania abortiva]|nr:hypothetical protein F5Y10DRAFT_262350 [Nemania abortiva]